MDWLNKSLFKRPTWLRPELDKPVYYIHVAIIIAGIYALMTWHNPENNLLIWSVYLIISDGIAHTILGLD